MEPADVLTTVAQLAVAFAGFSGIVAAMRRREEGGLFVEDGIRTDILIGSSFSTMGFALLPFAVWEVAGSAGVVWVVSSAIYFPYGVGVMWVSRQGFLRIQNESALVQQRIGMSAAMYYLSTFLMFPLVLAIQIGNVLWWHRFDAFLVALLWGLVGCAHGFIGLVRSLHRS
jgi:hypothetical protein